MIYIRYNFDNGCGNHHTVCTVYDDPIDGNTIELNGIHLLDYWADSVMPLALENSTSADDLRAYHQGCSFDVHNITAQEYEQYVRENTSNF